MTEQKDGNVIDIWSKSPHLSGEIKCLACKNEWIGVAPAGAVDLECPECHCHRGVFIWPIEPIKGETRFCCNGCNGEFFYIRTECTVCIGCGNRCKLEDILNL